jgi:hypothetical protein
MPNIIKAQPPLEFIPPAYNPLVYQLSRLILPIWTRWRAHIAGIQVSHAEGLAEVYQQFQANNIRFMMAFRHSSINDPFPMYHLLSQAVPRAAKQQGIKLKAPVHAHFMYDRGIPLWAGDTVGWLLSQLGGTSIRRGKLDLMGLRSARDLFANGQFPIAAAPEGATNGHNEIVSPLEPGIAQLGFWCVEDLQKAERSQQVLIVPIGIQYHYLKPAWQPLEQLLSQLEVDAGLPASAPSDIRPSEPNSPEHMLLSDPRQRALYRRLIRLSEHLLFRMEDFYSKFYHYDLKEIALTPPSPDDRPETANPETAPDGLSVNRQIARRLQALLGEALTVAEQYFKLPPKGNLSDRCRRLEQAGWDWIFREDLKQMETLPAIERSLADRIAEEADLYLWHMRLVESFVSVTGQYVIEKPTYDRFAETLLLLWEVITRIKGNVTLSRPSLGTQSVQMTVGAPISVSDRWQDYKANRRHAVAQLTQDMQIALENMII